MAGLIAPAPPGVDEADLDVLTGTDAAVTPAR